MSTIPPGPEWFDESYDAFPRVEDAFHAALDESLGPRGPEVLYDLVDTFGLAAGSFAVDVGCGEGRHALALAGRFGLDILGVDPLARHLELANAGLAEVAARDPELARRVHFEPGSAEALPLADGAADLVWCRDVLGPYYEAYACCESGLSIALSRCVREALSDSVSMALASMRFTPIP